jgi:hypothetical protein
MNKPKPQMTDAPGPAGAVREAIWVAIHGAVGFGGNHAVEITQATVAVIEQLEALGIDLRQEQEP